LALKVYLDASVLVALLTTDPLTARADAFMRAQAPVIVISSFAAAEVVSAVARRVRTREISADEAKATFSAMDAWIARKGGRTPTINADVRRADVVMRRLDLNLRTPDALHIAIAERLGAEMATFDDRMVAAARVLGLSVTTA
jgi:predicted nucleic acid-binding protein